MLFRIVVALTTLSFVHGADKSATDVAAASDAIRQQVPVSVAGLCLDNAALCQTIVIKASTGLLGTNASDEGMQVAQFPLPPRRPAMSAQGSMEKLDRAGLIRAINLGS